MTIIHTKIDSDAENYLLENSQHDNSDIDSVFNSAYMFDEPYMQISKLQATTLQFFIQSAGIENIVEIGTFVGYSAFSMAKILPPNVGNLTTIEINHSFHKQAEKNQYEYLRECREHKIKPLGSIDNIKFVRDDAKKYLPTMELSASEIDMIFLDGDKANYMFYLDWALKNLRTGGYFLVDNALFKGSVVKGKGDYAKGIRSMTQALKSCGCFDFFFLPVGDCMIIAKKK